MSIVSYAIRQRCIMIGSGCFEQFLRTMYTMLYNKFLTTFMQIDQRYFIFICHFFYHTRVIPMLIYERPGTVKLTTHHRSNQHRCCSLCTGLFYKTDQVVLVSTMR